jgi:multiple sugar transport system permease protein
MSSTFVKAEPYFFLAPALAILFVFLIFPLFWNIYISLHDVSLVTILNQWEYIGGTNFLDLFSDPNFYMSLKITLMFVGGSVALNLALVY